MNLVQTVL